MNTAFSGEGARLFGGRFNSEGLAAVYTSGSLSLSLLELLVQIEDRDYLTECVQIYADIPDHLIYEPDVKDFPKDWNTIPYGQAPQKFGDTWIKKGTFAAMKVPSVVVPVEFNFVINPDHRSFSDVKISKTKPVTLDPRLS